jgi:hypothetical protein
MSVRHHVETEGGKEETVAVPLPGYNQDARAAALFRPG